MFENQVFQVQSVLCNKTASNSENILWMVKLEPLVYTALSLKSPFSWDLTSHHWLTRYRHFVGSIFEINETDYLVNRSHIPELGSR